MGCDIHSYIEVYDVGLNGSEWRFHGPGCESRNYELFGILAGVREGNVTPIAQPRGVPEDISPEVKYEWESWGQDCHSASHLDLNEIEGYDWDNKLVHKCLMSALDYGKWKKAGKDKAPWALGLSTCKGASGENISEDEYDKRVDKGISMKDQFIHVKTSFTEKRAYYGVDFLNTTVEEMKELNRAPDEVRLVFWFDN